MKKIIYPIFGLVVTLIILSATNTQLSTCDSPIVGDHSGAPGETNCSGCHSAPVNPDVPEMHFEVGNGNTSYIPGTTYLVHLKIKRPGHNKFGFVCSSLDTLNTSKGAFGVINSATTRKYTLGGRNYFSHTPCGADAQDSIEWTYNWTAPTTNKGKIKIYMSMLVANHDHALTGDTTYTKVISLLPEVNNGLNNLDELTKTKVYPTIFSSEINIEFDKNYDNSVKQIFLMNSIGEILERYSNSNSRMVIPIKNTFANGVYFLKIKYVDFSENIKLIKS